MPTPDQLRTQHEKMQLQDEGALAEAARLLIASAEGFEEAAKVARSDELRRLWRQDAEDRWALAHQLGAWLAEHGFVAPREGTPVAANVHRGLMDIGAALQVPDNAAARAIEFGESAMHKRLTELQRQAELSEEAADLLSLALEHVEARSARASAAASEGTPSPPGRYNS